MSLATTIRAAVAPTVRTLIGELGSTAQVRRAVVSRAADNSEIRSWQTLAAGDGVPFLVTDEITERIQKEWGITGQLSAIGRVSDAVGITMHDGVIITSGHGFGRHFRVLRVRPSPFAGMDQVALQVTQERFV